MFNFFRKAPELPQCQYRSGGRKQRVLDFFQKRTGERVPLPYLLTSFRDIADPTRTLRYLIADGYSITNEVIHQKHGHSVHSYYTYNGIDTAQKKEKKKTYSKEDLDKNYEAGYQACLIQYNLK